MAKKLRGGGALGPLIVFFAAVGVASAVTVAPRIKTERQRVAVQTAPASAGPVVGGLVMPGVKPGVVQAAGPTVVTKPGLVCARGRNGGRTDKGVSGSQIHLAATVVQSGVGASFLGPVRFGMLSVLNKVNRAGGVCGRLLTLDLVDDGWDANRGAGFIRNFVAGDYFALAVNPSSEGLRVAIDSGDISRAGIPVVGSDGMLQDQYRDPWVWPVAASTISTMHVMAKNAYERGARRFGIVYESTYHFGIEGAAAFDAEVTRLTGKHIPGYSDPSQNPHCEKAFCGIVAGQSGYGSEVQTFNSACGSGACDFVALLLEPATALNWISSGGVTSGMKVGLGGPQPLFNDDFAEDCGQKCNGMWVWTGYNPPIYPFTGRAPVQEYVRDVKQTNANTDLNNSFVEGGYLGMRLLAEALRKVGPNLTRANLRRVLDSMTFDSGLTAPLRWTAHSHFANVSLQAFSIVANPNFAGWRYEQTGWVPDPTVGRI